MNPWSILPFLKTVNYTVSMDALGASNRKSMRRELTLDFATRKSTRDDSRTRRLLGGRDHANHHDEKRKSVLGPSPDPTDLPIAEAGTDGDGDFQA